MWGEFLRPVKGQAQQFNLNFFRKTGQGTSYTASGARRHYLELQGFTVRDMIGSHKSLERCRLKVGLCQAHLVLLIGWPCPEGADEEQLTF